MFREMEKIVKLELLIFAPLALLIATIYTRVQFNALLVYTFY